MTNDAKHSKYMRKGEFLNNQENGSIHEKREEEEIVGYNDFSIHFFN